MSSCLSSPTYSPLINTEHQERLHRQPAYLFVEGIGIHGSFNIRYSALVRSGALFVSASGYSAPMSEPVHHSSFQFFATAKIICNGLQTISKRLHTDGQELWPNDGYVSIGSARLCLPATFRKGKCELLLEAGYHFKVGPGYAVPTPSLARIRVPLEG